MSRSLVALEALHVRWVDFGISEQASRLMIDHISRRTVGCLGSGFSAAWRNTFSATDRLRT